MEIYKFGNCSKHFSYFVRDEVKTVTSYQSVNQINVRYLLYFAFFAVLVIRFRKRKRKTWIDSLPGPTAYPVIGNLNHFADLKQTFKIFLDWSKKYGRIFRTEGLFNEPFIFLNDPLYIQAVLSSHNLDHIGKPPITYNSIFGQFLKNGLLVSDGEYWKSHRRIVARAFTFKSFPVYNKIVNAHSRKIVDDLGKLFPKGKETPEFHEISGMIHCCSFQIICAAVMGLDASDMDKCTTFYKRFQRYKVISSQKAMNPFFLIEFFWRLHPMSREYDEIIDVLNGITREIIEKRNKGLVIRQKKEGNNNEDTGKNIRTMIDEMLESGMTPEEILIEVNTVIVAGFESTSLTIHYLLLLLALHPEHQRKCQEETDEVFNDPLQCVNGNLTLDAMSNLKYLELCLMETLRIFPVIFVFQRRLDAPLRLDNEYELPAGTNVVIPTYSIHHNNNYFKEADVFNPSRFNENVEEKNFLLSFSSGIRNCVGMKFAMLEIKAVAAHIIRNYSISTVDNVSDVPILPSIVMTPERDYLFHLKQRNIM